jgi:phage terminase large subunit GpA-like protein
LATRLTAGIDVQQTLLYYAVVAWEDNFTGYVIDYGAWPDQGRPYFTLADARQTLLTATGATSLEGSILQGLTRLGEQILGRNWEREDGAAMRVARCLIDTNWKPSAEPIHQYCRNGAFASVVMPSYGMPTTSTRDPYTSYKRKQGERVGTNWRMPSVRGTRLARHVLMDPNHWKSFLYSRLAVQLGDPGCLSLYGTDAGRHRMLADHVTAERRNLIENKTTQRLVEVWEQKGGRPDNHLLDCVYAACVAAEIEGVALAEMPTRTNAGGRARMKLSDRQQRHQQRRAV